MKKLKRKCLVLLIIIIMSLLMNTDSQAFYVKEINFSKQTLNSNNIYGVCKIYKDNEVIYYKTTSTGSNYESIEETEAETTRNNIKRKIDALKNGEYLLSKILKSTSYYDEMNKEFCYKRDSASVSTDLLEKVIIIGYNDEYEFKSKLASSNGAYIVKKLGGTEEFYVSYEDTWIESELSMSYDANSIVLDKTRLEVKVGDTAEVKYTVLPEDALSKAVTVTYSDGIEIDTTTSGVIKIKAISEGEAYIIVKLKANNEITAKCDIKVVSDTSVIPPNPEPDPNPDPDPNPNPDSNPTPIDGKITSNKYSVNVDKGYISKIMPKTEISEFESNIMANVDYKIYDTSGKLVTDKSTLVATGMKLETEKQEYLCIVKGDIDGNGKISITDVVKANLYSVHIQTPNDMQKIAADINEDGKITITDVVQLNLASVNIKPIE